MADPALPRRFGPYVLLAERGRGGAGTVFLARPIERPRDPARALVIVKLLHPSLLTNPVQLQRFRHEALIAVSVSAPELVRVFDVGSVGEVPYIAMEYVAGWSVTEVGRGYGDAARRPPIGLVVAWMCDALVALEALHAAIHPSTGEPMGIVHRDISPKNLLIGEDLRLRVIDFGLGTSNVQDWATRANVIMGTPGYMAPEQVRGGRVDARTDLYALAVVTYEFLTLGYYVPRGEPSEMMRHILSPAPRPMSRSDLPPGLEAVIRRGLAVEPERRFPDARAFREALGPFAASARARGDLPPTLEDRGEVELTEPGVAILAASPEPTVLYATRASSPLPSSSSSSSAASSSVDGAETHVGAAPPDTQVVSAPATRILGVDGGRTLGSTRGPSVPSSAGASGSASARASGARLWGLSVAALALAAAVVGVAWVARVGGAEVPPPLPIPPLPTTAPAEVGARVESASPGSPTASPGSPVASPGLPAASPGSPTASPVASPGSPTASPASPVASPASPVASPGLPVASPGSPVASPGLPSASAAPPSAAPQPTRVSPSRPPRVTSAPAPRAPEVRAPADSVEGVLARLIARAQAARARRPERQREIDEILTDASLWSRAEDQGRALSMLKGLEARLDGLDR